MRRSFLVRLAAAFAGVAIVSAALTAILVNVAFGGLLAGYLDQQQQGRQQEVAALLESAYQRSGGWDAAELDALTTALRAQIGAGSVTVRDERGDVVWQLEPGRPGMGGMGAMMGSPSLGSVQQVPLTANGARVGTALVQLPVPAALAVNTSFRDSVNRMLLLGGLLGAAVAAALGYILARRVTAPVRELTVAAGALARGDRSLRVKHASRDEFGEMANAFNSLADAVTEEDRLRRTFAADVAHELRTPLMILSSHLEAIEDGVLQPDLDTIRSLQEETRRLAALVSDLEVLASADAAGFTLQRQVIDLGDLVAGTVAEFRPLLAEGGVEVRTAVEAVDVAGDAVRLKQVVSNLLTNALRFTPRGGSVEVAVARREDGAVLTITDTGAGIPDAELPHVFDRFFRGASSPPGGSGVGLAVVRELVIAHGGRVSAANASGGGAVFTVEIPRIGSSRLSAA